jgi:acetolactate synthase-1/3 small subunit|uniref:acetohydroxyacid synthetase small subunit n=1 Tax=Tenuicylindrus belgicus TaxID=1398096 RepID=UPI00223902E0|nr:acetohydroxyacid synthetase small subunit [Tenuicylindrus belgicus]UYC31552.1 acetohydroxyacid synthetase small subunit [Tenuicylindrus belgicus]
MNYECTLTVLIENQPGILTRVTGLLSRKGFKIDSLAIGDTETKHISRLTLVLFGNNRIVNQITKQLYKLFHIIKIQNITNIPSIRRELLLLKILTYQNNRSKILEISTFFRAKILDFSEKTLTFEVTGDSEKVLALEQLINQFGIIESARTGKIALSRESLMNTKIFRNEHKLSRLKLVSAYATDDLMRSYII